MRLGQVDKRTRVGLKAAKTLHERFAGVLSEAIPGSGNIAKLSAVIVAKDQGVERAATNCVSAERNGSIHQAVRAIQQIGASDR